MAGVGPEWSHSMAHELVVDTWTWPREEVPGLGLTCAGSGHMDVAKRGSSWPGVDRRGRRSSKGVSVTSWPRA